MVGGAKHLGGFVRWALKGFRTKLWDEINANYESKLTGSYELENYIIGYLTVVILLGIILLIFFN